MSHPSDPRPPIAEIGFEIDVPIVSSATERRRKPASSTLPRREKILTGSGNDNDNDSEVSGDDTGDEDISMMNYRPSPPEPIRQNPHQPYNYDLRHPDHHPQQLLNSHSHHSCVAPSGPSGGHRGSHPTEIGGNEFAHQHPPQAHGMQLQQQQPQQGMVNLANKNSNNDNNNSKRRGSMNSGGSSSNNTTSDSGGEQQGGNSKPDPYRKAYRLVTRTSQKMDMNSKFINFENEAAIPTFDRNELHLGPRSVSGTFNDLFLLNEIQLCPETYNPNASKTVKRKREQIAHQSQTNLGGAQGGATTFAVKILKRDLQSDKYAKGAQQLVKEQKFLANLQHPHIVKLCGTPEIGFSGFANPEGGGYFLLVEKMEISFKRKIQEWRTQVDEAASLPNNKKFKMLLEKQKHKEQVNLKKRELFLQRLQVTADIASAVTYLHSHGIVYRDINPKTLGFDVTSQKVKLLDFGKAKELGKNQHVEGTRQTMIGSSSSGSAPAYYYYLAPEIILGQSYDTSADVYSFGILLWHISSLKVPFRGQIGTPSDFLQQVSKGMERPPLHESWSAVLKNVMRWSWVDDRTVRPPMHEIHKAIQREIRIRPTSGFGTLQVSADDRLNGISQISKSTSSLELQDNTTRVKSNKPVPQMTSRSARAAPRIRSRSAENIRNFNPTIPNNGGIAVMQRNTVFPTSASSPSKVQPPRRTRSVEDIRAHGAQQRRRPSQQQQQQQQQTPVRKTRSSENIRKLPIQDWGLHAMQAANGRQQRPQQQHQQKQQHSASSNELKQLRRSSMKHQQNTRRRSIAGSGAEGKKERRGSLSSSSGHHPQHLERGGGSGHPRMARRPSLEMMRQPPQLANAPPPGRMQRRRSLGF